MNICLLSKSQLKSVGGIESYTDLIADAFIRRGHKIHIITSGKNVNINLENKYSNKNIVIHKIDFEDFKVPGVWRIDKVFPLSMLYYAYLVGRKIKKLSEIYNFDIIESPNRAFEGLFLGWNRRVPLVVRLHGGILVDKLLNLSRYHFRDKIIGQLEKFLICKADLITSPSISIAQIVNKGYDIEQSIVVVPNPVDLTQFYSSGNEAAVPTIIYAGRFQELKGVFILAEAIPEVLNQFPDACFLFVGPDSCYGKRNGSCKQFLSEKINDQRVRFLSEVSAKELAKLYNKSWICVFPSFYESFGIAALEAMACGKAVIATNVGGFAEIIENGVNGLLVPPADAATLTSAIVKLLMDNEFRKNIGKNGSEKAKNFFDLDKISCSLIKIYEDLINKSK